MAAAKLSLAPLEHTRDFFCSDVRARLLVAALWKHTGLWETNVEAASFWPRDLGVGDGGSYLEHTAEGVEVGPDTRMP